MELLNPQSAYMLLTRSDAMQMGKGLFETMLVVNAKPLFLSAHIKRLNESLSSFFVPITLVEDIVGDFIALEVHGQGDMKGTSKRWTAKLSVFICDKRAYWHIHTGPDRYVVGPPWPMHLAIANYLVSSERPLAKHKTMNYWQQSRDLGEAQAKGYDEVVYFDENGYLLEGSKTNVLIYKDKAWFTPKDQSGILNGIAKDWFVAQLKARGYTVEHVSIHKSDFFSADIVAVTNSLIGVTWASHSPASTETITHSREILGVLTWLKGLQEAYRGGLYG